MSTPCADTGLLNPPRLTLDLEAIDGPVIPCCWIRGKWVPQLGRASDADQICVARLADRTEDSSSAQPHRFGSPL